MRRWRAAVLLCAVLNVVAAVAGAILWTVASVVVVAAEAGIEVWLELQSLPSDLETAVRICPR